VGNTKLQALFAFSEETELTKKPKTLSAYTTALNYFTESCPKLYLQDIERADLLKFQLPEGRGRAGEPRRQQLPASQVPGDACHTMSLGRG
jgi:hypothetical protein